MLPLKITCIYFAYLGDCDIHCFYMKKVGYEYKNKGQKNH
jgi:hypothetical protein